MESLNLFIERAVIKKDMGREVALARMYHRFKSYVLRTCTNCKWCCLCKNNIMAGEQYRDGRKVDNMAHETCVDKIGSEL